MDSFIFKKTEEKDYISIKGRNRTIFSTSLYFLSALSQLNKGEQK